MAAEELTNRIKVFRAARSISQEELAVAVGVTRKTINTIETGKYVPSTVLALRIARYFGVPVEEVFSFIGSHLEEPMPLEFLAARFYVSPEHLARQFKKQTGQTLHQYILRARLARCRALLCDGVPLAAIWPQCGFSGYRAMLRAFKRHFGVSPTEYYRQCRQRALAEEAKAPAEKPR